VQRLAKLADAYPNARLAAVFAVWALPWLLAMAWLTPPWQNPDEPLHFARIVQIAHGGLLGYRDWGTSGGQSDRAIYRAYAGVQHAAMRPDQRLSLQDLAKSGSIGWSRGTEYTSFPNTAQYPPFFYLPAAASYWAGRAANLSINHTLLLARMLNVLLFTAMAAATLAIARRTRLPLLAILMLPTTLSLACTAGQDSLMQGATLLAVALIDRVACEQRSATRREAALATLLLACVAMARPPYAGFLLALGLLAPSPWRPLKRLALPAAGIVLAWCLLVAWHTTVRLMGSDAHTQLALLIAHPAAVPAIVIGTFQKFTGRWWREMIGVLGWTDTPLPRPYIFCASVTLVLAFLSLPGPRPRHPWIAPLGIAFVVAAILALQYVTWTWPGQPVVTGILGRYFTTPTMVLALCMPSLGRAQNFTRPAAISALLALGIITPAITLHTIILRYYVQ
jgi:uncharacterized membrane protein